MATATRKSDGQTINYTAATAVTAGDIVPLGDGLGVAVNDIAASAVGALQVTGVFALPKSASEAMATQLDNVYWDADNERVTLESTDGASVPTSHKLIGKTAATAAETATTVDVLLHI